MEPSLKCYDCDEKIKNYERRLAIVTQEKDLAVEMLQSEAQRIEQLEQELNFNEDKKKFEAFRRQIKEANVQLQSDYSDVIEILESKLALVSCDLEQERQKVNSKEVELKELQNKVAALQIDQEQLNELQHKEKTLLQKCLDLESKCNEYENVLQSFRPTQVLEEEVDRLRRQLSTIERQRSELQDVLDETKKSAERLASEELEARHKVCEAISLVETTLVEKQQIQNQLLLSESECKRLQKELMGLIEEAGKRVIKEVEAVKKSFHEELLTAESQMNFLETEKNKKTSQLEKQQQEIIKLENEIEELKRRSVSPRKLQAVTEELMTTQAQLQQLQTENKSLNEKMMQNQHRYESEMSKCGIERRFLEKQILKLQTNLGETSHNLERAVEQCHQLADHLNKLSAEIVTERATNESESSELMKQLHITKVQSNCAMEELKKFVDNHNSITSKWKDEYITVTSKFSDRIKVLRSENKKEKKRSRKLLKKLTNIEARKGMNVCDDEASIDGSLIIAALDLNSSTFQQDQNSSFVSQV